MFLLRRAKVFLILGSICGFGFFNCFASKDGSSPSLPLVKTTPLNDGGASTNAKVPISNEEKPPVNAEVEVVPYKVSQGFKAQALDKEEQSKASVNVKVKVVPYKVSQGPKVQALNREEKNKISVNAEVEVPSSIVSQGFNARALDKEENTLIGEMIPLKEDFFIKVLEKEIQKLISRSMIRIHERKFCKKNYTYRKFLFFEFLRNEISKIENKVIRHAKKIPNLPTDSKSLFVYIEGIMLKLEEKNQFMYKEAVQVLNTFHNLRLFKGKDEEKKLRAIEFQHSMERFFEKCLYFDQFQENFNVNKLFYSLITELRSIISFLLCEMIETNSVRKKIDLRKRRINLEENLRKYLIKDAWKKIDSLLKNLADQWKWDLTDLIPWIDQILLGLYKEDSIKYKEVISALRKFNLLKSEKKLEKNEFEKRNLSFTNQMKKVKDLFSNKNLDKILCKRELKEEEEKIKLESIEKFINILLISAIPREAKEFLVDLSKEVEFRIGEMRKKSWMRKVSIYIHPNLSDICLNYIMSKDQSSKKCEKYLIEFFENQKKSGLDLKKIISKMRIESEILDELRVYLRDKPNFKNLFKEVEKKLIEHESNSVKKF